jgi:cysteine desulfurase
MGSFAGFSIQTLCMTSTRPIYLDNNATTFLDPEVAQAMFEVETAGLANPSSQHRLGRQALHLLESAKESILQSVNASMTGMSAAQVILTSGGSEANNLALHAFTHQKPGLVIVGSLEHPSLLVAAELSAICLNPVKQLAALATGCYDLEQLEQVLQSACAAKETHANVALVSLMLANNETGVINDIGRAAKLCQRYSVPLHCDIIQAVGKVDFHMQELGVAAITLNAHKQHGPVGIGALVVDSTIQARPMLVGGGQQLGWRAGTEPVALAVGMAKSLEVSSRCRELGDYAAVALQRDRFEATICQQLDFVAINGQGSPRVPQTSNLAFVGFDRQALQMALDLEGVACSAGAACASGSSRPSPTLQAMGLTQQRVAGSLRFSLSRMTTDEEVDRVSEIVVRVAKKLKSK